MVVPRDISEQRLDYVHWDMDGNQMFRYPMDIQEMGCATWDRANDALFDLSPPRPFPPYNIG